MTNERPRRVSRRALLAAGGAAAVGTLAGCTGRFTSGEENETTTETADEESNDASVGDLLGGHPVANGLLDQPRFGPPPAEAEGVVVAFEDPSCPRCAAFETGTVPKLREQLGGQVSFLLRSYPVVYPWGKPAAQVIEAAFAHEMEAKSGEMGTAPADAPKGYRQGSVATWALADYYFEEQDQFDKSNVLDRTQTFLAEETELDAEAVVADAEAEAYDDAVQADLSAGEAADVGQTTPTIFLFRDGEFRTSAKGSISFQVVKSALEL